MFNNEWGPVPNSNAGGTNAMSGDPNEIMRRLAEMLKRFGAASGPQQVGIPMGPIDALGSTPPMGGRRA
jgi:hypothetical protein